MLLKMILFKKRNSVKTDFISIKTPGPGCLKLTTSLVNISLKFQTLRIFEICKYYMYLSKKRELLQYRSFSHFSTKKFSVFGYKVVKHLTSSLC